MTTDTTTFAGFSHVAVVVDDLDAALTFVKSRYDLNLGLWDLARDPVLRTLLQRQDDLDVRTSYLSLRE